MGIFAKTVYFSKGREGNVRLGGDGKPGRAVPSGPGLFNPTDVK